MRLVGIADRPRVEFPDIETYDASQLAPLAREAALFVWSRRHAGEFGAVGLATALIASAEGFGDEVNRALVRFRHDEVSHVRVAARMVRAFGGAAPRLTAPKKFPPTPVRFAGLVLTGLCVAETIAAHRFVRAIGETDERIPRQCLEGFLADETHHAETGFLLLPLAFDALRAADVDPVAVLTKPLYQTLVRFAGDLASPAARVGPLTLPPGNAGVATPAMDAMAFDSALIELLPRLDEAGFPATRMAEGAGLVC